MQDTAQYYSYGNYLVHRAGGEKHFNPADSQGDQGHVHLDCQQTDRALEQAAKKICTLKCGLCPVKEKDFAGCHVPCHDEIRPWQCWVAHFKRLGAASGKPM